MSSALTIELDTIKSLPDNSDDAAAYPWCSIYLKQVMQSFGLSFNPHFGE
jgi:hypothetical protein